MVWLGRNVMLFKYYLYMNSGLSKDFRSLSNVSMFSILSFLYLDYLWKLLNPSHFLSIHMFLDNFDFNNFELHIDLQDHIKLLTISGVFLLEITQTGISYERQKQLKSEEESQNWIEQFSLKSKRHNQVNLCIHSSYSLEHFRSLPNRKANMD